MPDLFFKARKDHLNYSMGLNQGTKLGEVPHFTFHPSPARMQGARWQQNGHFSAFPLPPPTAFCWFAHYMGGQRKAIRRDGDSWGWGWGNGHFHAPLKSLPLIAACWPARHIRVPSRSSGGGMEQ